MVLTPALSRATTAPPTSSLPLAPTHFRARVPPRAGLQRATVIATVDLALAAAPCGGGAAAERAGGPGCQGWGSRCWGRRAKNSCWGETGRVGAAAASGGGCCNLCRPCAATGHAAFPFQPSVLRPRPPAKVSLYPACLPTSDTCYPPVLGVPIVTYVPRRCRSLRSKGGTAMP